MARNIRKNIFFLSAIILLCFTSLTSAGTANAEPSSWTGDPDPYDCNTWEDCYWTMIVCIDGVAHEVGYYFEPATRTDAEKEQEALDWTGTELTVGKCAFRYTGRWNHTYAGKTWTCNLVSEAGEDKHAPRFSNLDYVKQTCGEHELFGPFQGTAEYTVCREKYSNGSYYCGNHHDTSY